MKMNESLEKWEYCFNKSLETNKLDYPLIKKMLKDNSFTKRSLEELNKTDKDFSEQLKLLTENSISAFELLSLIVGYNEFIKDFDNIYFHGFDLTNFDTRYIFDENVSD